MLSLAHTHHSAPSVVRGTACTFGSGTCGGETVLAYGSGTQAVLRSAADPAKLHKTFGGHARKVTAVRVSPCGRFCASADEGGNLRVWSTDPTAAASAKEFQPLSSPVRDLAWSHDGERLVIVGEGRTTRGIVINAQMGTTMGDLAGITGDMTSCDFRKDRPFRIAIGSADSMTGFYEGPPFKFTSSIKGEHKAKVTSVRFSPDNMLIASVSGAPQIVLQDGKTGEMVRKIETGHKGTVYAVAWSADGSQLATASADKTMRCFNVADGAEVFSTTLGSAVRDMQMGVTAVPSGWVSINLGGDLSFVGHDGGVVRCVRGFEKSVKSIHPLPDGTLVCSNYEGRVLAFPAEGDALAFGGKEPQFVEGGSACADGVMLWTGEKAVHANSATRELQSGLETKALIGVSVSPTAFVVAEGNNLLLFVNGKETSKTALGKRARAAVCSGSMVAIATEASVAIFAVEGTELHAKTTIDVSSAHRSDISAIALSEDGTRLAAGDTTNVLSIWDAMAGTAVATDLAYHNSRITCLAFAPGSANVLASGGNDNMLILWDLSGNTRVKVENAHVGPVTSLAFVSSGLLASGGHDGCVKRWAIE